jgi:hypothetical protein
MIELGLIGAAVLFVFLPGIVGGIALARRIRRWMR